MISDLFFAPVPERGPRWPAWAMVVFMTLAAWGVAQEVRSLALPDGGTMDYVLWLPDDFEAERSYPLLLALPPGSQNLEMVGAGLGYWRSGPQRDWVVVSPAAPGGRLFFRGAEAHIAALLDEIAETVTIEGVHLAGISNGGRSAFRIARLDPDRFASLLVLPGFPPEEDDFDALDLLVSLPVRMFVGENDPDWAERSRVTAARLADLGGDVELTVVPNEGHVIQSLSGETLFDLLDGLR